MLNRKDEEIFWKIEIIITPILRLRTSTAPSIRIVFLYLPWNGMDAKVF